ncbi:MAG TPA: hypothetical protein VFN87_02660 [Solirubrobacteraceae bacterium]|nr:hypothetical protein [Solirubrobacteraceae bacterium]
MQSAFGTVVLVVCAVGVAGAVAALLLNRRTWDEYGRNQLVRDSDSGARPVRPPAAGAGAGADAERDEEIRQMLEARNARRQRRGEPELDLDAELGRLTAPLVDDELRAEIRDLVVARNHRRVRQGKPPLDVSAEVEREIARLTQP